MLARTALRISADFNSRLQDDRGMWCWCLRHNGRALDEFTDELALYEGMPVIIYHEDLTEEFEYDAVLGRSADPSWAVMWMARYEENALRRVRGSALGRTRI
jgi:hypothetical protein